MRHLAPTSRGGQAVFGSFKGYSADGVEQDALIAPGDMVFARMHQGSRRGTEWRASFGPFTLSPFERLLERDGVRVRLGGRALDLLIALVDSAGEIVSKKDLITRVWADLVASRRDEGG